MQNDKKNLDPAQGHVDPSTSQFELVWFNDVEVDLIWICLVQWHGGQLCSTENQTTNSSVSLTKIRRLTLP